MSRTRSLMECSSDKRIFKLLNFSNLEKSKGTELLVP